MPTVGDDRTASGRLRILGYERLVHYCELIQSISVFSRAGLWSARFFVGKTMSVARDSGEREECVLTFIRRSLIINRTYEEDQ